MNHFSINVQPSDTLWYTPMEQHHPHHHHPPKSYPFFFNTTTTTTNNHHNLSSPVKYDDVDSDNSSSNANADRSETTASSTTTANAAALDKEHMFEKPLTPSDVGKLNRLVIPKQHAEKYFPLAGVSTAATAVGSGGVLLGFEDEGGKCWRFRYSYWNSSQSYVLTKGWSRYVKEKKLDAGDVVLFERHRFDPDRFFIGWRRRGSNPVHNICPAQASWTAQRSPSSYNHGYNYHHHQNVVQSQQQHAYAASHQISPTAFPYPPESLHAGTEVRPERQRAKKSGKGNSNRVRLFGVNLECQLEDDDDDDQGNDDEPQTSDGSSLSSQGLGQGFGLGSGPSLTMAPASYNYFDYMGYPPNHHSHMDMNYAHDVNQMRNRLG